MRWQLELVTGPEFEPITLTEMKTHLRAYTGDTSRDDEITELIKAAREWIEDYTGQVCIDQTWRLSLDQNDQWLDETPAGWSGSTDDPDFYLRRSPALGIVSVKTVDADGAETTVDSAEYELRASDSKFPFVVPTSGATWQDSNLRITFRAGFADTTASPQDTASVVPAMFKQAMKMFASGIYDKDEHSYEAAMHLAKTLKAQVGFA